MNKPHFNYKGFIFMRILVKISIYYTFEYL